MLKKFSRYHEHLLRYDILNFDRMTVQKDWSPLVQNLQIRAVILFQQFYLSFIFNVSDDYSMKKKKMGINYKM